MNVSNNKSNELQSSGNTIDLKRRIPIEEQVKEILKRKVNLPLPNRPKDPSSDQVLKHILQTKEIVKREYIEKQCLADELYEKCITLILQELNCQKLDVQQLQDNHESLMKRNEALTVKYDTIIDKQSSLSERLEKVISSLSLVQPGLSEAEVQMKAQLQAVQEDIKLYKNSVKELKTRKEYIDKVLPTKIAVVSKPQRRPIDDPHVERQLEKIRTSLTEQSEATNELIHRMNNLKQWIHES